MLRAIQAIQGNTGNTECDFVVTHISWSTLSHKIIHILVASAVIHICSFLGPIFVIEQGVKIMNQ